MTESQSENLLDLFALFMRNSMHSAFLHARGTGLSMPQLNTLMVLKKRGSVAISEIAGEMGVSKAAVSQMVDRMVNEGLILRTEDPNDRRVKQITLTDKGRQLIREHYHARRKWHQQLIDTLSGEETKQVNKAFEILAEKLQEMEVTNSENGDPPKP